MKNLLAAGVTALTMLATTSYAADGNPPRLGGYWTLQNGRIHAASREAFPAVPEPPFVERLTLHHEEDGKQIIFGCGVNEANEVKYSVSYYYLNDYNDVVRRLRRSPAWANLSVTFSVDGQAKLRAAGGDIRGTSISVPMLDGKHIETLAAAKQTLQINVDDYPSYSVVRDGAPSAPPVGLGLADFKVICERAQ
jgi:hypothetical protein